MPSVLKKQNKPNDRRRPMSHRDDLHPRFVCAFYFAIFAVGFNLLAKYFLYVVKAGVLLPFFSTTLLSLLLGALLGSLFGPRLARLNRGAPLFFSGMLLAIAMTPCYSLGLQIIYYFHNHSLYHNLHQWQDYVVLYGVILLFFTLIAGIWFIPLAGFAALHFNRHFLPGYQKFLSQLPKKEARH